MKLVKFALTPPIAAISVALFAALSSFGMTYYVDYETGDNGNNGTTAPWKTLAYAVSADSGVVDNDEIVLAKGPHVLGTGAITIDKKLHIHGAGENWETVLDANHQSLTITISAEGAVVNNVTFYRLTAANNNGNTLNMTGASTVSNAVFTSCGSESGNSQGFFRAAAGLVTCCYVTNNTCVYNTGMFLDGDVIVENSVFVHNTMLKGGYNYGVLKIKSNKLTVRNCTIANNIIAGDIGAIGAGDWADSGYVIGNLHNNIIWGNVDSVTGLQKNYYTRDGKNATWLNNCTTPVEKMPASNVAGDPEFRPDGMHIGAKSSCKGTADPSLATECDITGRARGTDPCIGAFEYVEEAVMVLEIVEPEVSAVRQPGSIPLACIVTGTYTSPLTFEWHFNGASETVDSTDAETAITEVGVYLNPRVVVRDAAGQVDEKKLEGYFSVHIPGMSVFHVDYANGNDMNDGSESHPWKTLASATANAAVFDGDEIILAKGVHTATASATIDKRLHVHGAGECGETIVTAPGNMGNFVIIKADGVLLNNITFADSKADYMGAILTMDSDSVVSNITVTGCGSPTSRGNTTISASRGLITRCAVTNNYGSSACGFALSGGAVVENCLVANNRTVLTGKDSTGSVGFNYSYNSAVSSLRGMIRNCTVVDNLTSTNSQTGVRVTHYVDLCNNIIRGNRVVSTGEDANWADGDGRGRFMTNCTTRVEALTANSGNFDADPLFKDAANGNYRLDFKSPCRNAGDNGSWTKADIDLDGHSRLVGRRVDLGCYECQLIPGFGILVR